MEMDSSSPEGTARREFLKTSAGMAGAAALGPLSVRSPAAQQDPVEKTVGIQIGTVSFVDEGVDQVLDNVQQLDQINTIFLNTFGWDRGLNGRQIHGHPFPDHGK